MTLALLALCLMPIILPDVANFLVTTLPDGPYHILVSHETISQAYAALLVECNPSWIMLLCIKLGL